MTPQELEFDAEEWQSLEPAERVRRCRLLAARHKQLSTDAAPDLKIIHLELSQCWLEIAREIDRHERGHGPLSARSQAGAFEHGNG